MTKEECGAVGLLLPLGGYKENPITKREELNTPVEDGTERKAFPAQCGLKFAQSRERRPLILIRAKTKKRMKR